MKEWRNLKNKLKYSGNIEYIIDDIRDVKTQDKIISIALNKYGRMTAL
ncbi:MAG: hypothetical protein U5N58_08340 [Actinomycetota bacterium]|nr:hypothetical protein [Actinomycetota bacterium]